MQHAVDVADPGDEVYIAAGTYTGVRVRGGARQMAYIDKSITLRGGFTPPNWNTSDPANNPTILDAQKDGRVLVIIGEITATVEGLYLTGGHATNAGGNGTGPFEDNGGGVYVATATIVLSNNRIVDNRASSYGGGVFLLESKHATLNGNLIDSNRCKGMSCEGGGVFLLFSDATLSRNTISRNRSDLHGAGVELAASTGLLNNNTIISNTASVNYGISMPTYSFGGGVYLSTYSLARLKNNLISGNEAYIGGGMALYLGSRATLESNTISDNSAEGGGGVALYYDTEATLTNTVIVDNQAAGVGSGLYIDDSSARLSHTTLARNGGGDGSGVHIIAYPPASSTIILTNTILVSHTVGITAAVGSTAILDGVLWFSNGTNVGGPGEITVTNEYTGNPAFAADGYHLTPASAALDRGLNVGVTTDIDGESRPFGGGFDLGADEGQPALLVTKQASPELARPGAALTYTIQVTNTGFVTLTATITDMLPDHVTPSGVRTWGASIAPFGGVWIGQVLITVQPGYTGSLTNVVEVTTDEGVSGIYSQVATVGRLIYLPVVLREH